MLVLLDVVYLIVLIKYVEHMMFIMASMSNDPVEDAKVWTWKHCHTASCRCVGYAGCFNLKSPDALSLTNTDIIQE